MNYTKRIAEIRSQLKMIGQKMYLTDSELVYTAQICAQCAIELLEIAEAQQNQINSKLYGHVMVQA